MDTPRDETQAPTAPPPSPPSDDSDEASRLVTPPSELKPAQQAVRRRKIVECSPEPRSSSSEEESWRITPLPQNAPAPPAGARDEEDMADDAKNAQDSQPSAPSTGRSIDLDRTGKDPNILTSHHSPNKATLGTSNYSSEAKTPDWQRQLDEMMALLRRTAEGGGDERRCASPLRDGQAGEGNDASRRFKRGSVDEVAKMQVRTTSVEGKQKGGGRSSAKAAEAPKGDRLKLRHQMQLVREKVRGLSALVINIVERQKKLADAVRRIDHRQEALQGKRETRRYQTRIEQAMAEQQKQDGRPRAAWYEGESATPGHRALGHSSHQQEGSRKYRASGPSSPAYAPYRPHRPLFPAQTANVRTPFGPVQSSRDERRGQWRK